MTLIATTALFQRLEGEQGADDGGQVYMMHLSALDRWKTSEAEV